MKYYVGKVLLIGSSSILLLEATVCIVRKLNICLLARKNNCVFCQKEKRQISKKSGCSNYTPIPQAKSYYNFTVLPRITRTMMSIFNDSWRSRLNRSNTTFDTEEKFINDMKSKENMETEYGAPQIPKLNDNFQFS